MGCGGVYIDWLNYGELTNPISSFDTTPQQILQHSIHIWQFYTIQYKSISKAISTLQSIFSRCSPRRNREFTTLPNVKNPPASNEWDSGVLISSGIGCFPLNQRTEPRYTKIICNSHIITITIYKLQLYRIFPIRLIASMATDIESRKSRTRAAGPWRKIPTWRTSWQCSGATPCTSRNRRIPRPGRGDGIK